MPSPGTARPSGITRIPARRPVLRGGLGRIATELVPVGTSAMLPERVRRAIRAEQDRSEVLVGLVQAVAVVFFAAVYAITPKAFPPTVPFEPIPWTLAVYAAFTGVRLWLAIRRRLRPWFLALSVVVDIAVLMITIWSFHLQYQTPPGLYLKAPTLLYAFILIALRALRFEAGLVVLAGLAAISGWLALVAYAVLAGDSGITRHFAHYMMSFDILIGAEIDKLLSFGAVTLILALAITRARGLLVRAVTEQQAAMELARFLDPAVADQVRAAETTVAPGEGVIREAAVLFTDLRGFTRLSATLSPSETIRLIGEYQARLVPLVQAHGGSIDKYLGDGIMASFGAVRPSATAAADALRALEAILAETEAWGRERAAEGLPPVRVGAAVATGPMLFGAVGHATRLEYTVIGEPVNLAAKLEKHTKAEGVAAVCPAATYDRALAQGFAPTRPAERRDRRAVEGVAQPLDLVLLG